MGRNDFSYVIWIAGATLGLNLNENPENRIITLVDERI